MIKLLRSILAIAILIHINMLPDNISGQLAAWPLPLEIINKDSLYRVVKLKEQQRDFVSLGKLYSGIYAYYLTTPFKDSAIQYAIRCEESSLMGGDSSTYYNALVSLGYLAAEAHNVEDAKAYLMKSLPYFLRINNNEMLFHVYGNLGNVYTQLKDVATAAYYDSLAERATLLSNDVWGQVVINDAKAQKLLDQNRIDESIALLKYNLIKINNALPQGKGQQYKIQWRGIALNLLATCFYLKKDYNNTILYADQALRNDTGSIVTGQAIESCRLLANAFMKLGKADSATKYTDLLFQNFEQKVNRLDPAKQNEISVKYEAEKKQREINELRQKQQVQQLASQNQRNLNVAFFIIICLLFAAGYYFIKNLQNKSKVVKELAIKQLIQQDEVHHRKELQLRNSISRDLHDDIGSSLSSIKAYSEILKSNPRYPSLPDLIAENAGDLIERLEVIVWASNTQFDTYSSLVSKMKKYAGPLLAVKGINFSFDTNGIAMETQIPGELRQNILLIFKETINNVAKYSSAGQCTVNLFAHENTFVLSISDNGVGIAHGIKGTGYGLSSIKKRAAEIGGKIFLMSENGQGTTITLELHFPFQIPA